MPEYPPQSKEGKKGKAELLLAELGDLKIAAQKSGEKLNSLDQRNSKTENETAEIKNKLAELKSERGEKIEKGQSLKQELEEAKKERGKIEVPEVVEVIKPVEEKIIEPAKEEEKEKQELEAKLKKAIREKDVGKIDEITDEINKKFVKTKTEELEPVAQAEETASKYLTPKEMVKIGTEAQEEQEERRLREEEKEKIPMEARLGEIELKRKNDLEKGPLSARIKNGVINGIEKWENWGKEKGVKGYAKRFTKMAINLALIGAISSVSVDQLAKAGIGTAAALSGGVTSYLGRKMVIGLGIGGIMEAGGKKIPDKVKKWMPYVLGIGSIGAATLLTGGVAGVAAGLSFGAGLAFSKLVKGKFSAEQIKKREEEARQKLLEKLGKGGEIIDENRLREIEDEYTKILKKYENQRIWGKLLDGAKKLGVGALVSTVSLEASGFAHELHQPKVETGHQAEIKHEAEIKHQAELKHEAEVKHEAEIKHEIEANRAIEQKSVQEFMKTNSTQEAIKLGLYNPGAETESAFVQHGTMSFVDENGHRIEVPLSSHGAIQTIHDLKNKILQEYGGDITKVPAGHIDMHYADMKGIEHDQILIKGDTVEQYQGTMGHAGAPETHVPPEQGDQYAVPEQEAPEGIHPAGYTIEQETPEGINVETPVEGMSAEQEREYLTGQIENNEELAKNLGWDGKENLHHFAGLEAYRMAIEKGYYPEVSAQIDQIYEDNANHLFGDKATFMWDNVLNSHEDNLIADKMMHLTIHEGLTDETKNLVKYLNTLHEVTGLNPTEETLITPAETNNEYITRALIKAAVMGQLDKVKL